MKEENYYYNKEQKKSITVENYGQIQYVHIKEIERVLLMLLEGELLRKCDFDAIL